MLARNIEQPVLCWKDVVERLGPAASKQISLANCAILGKRNKRL